MRGDHLVVRTRGARPDCDLAGIPPELLPPKKRAVRHHPYAAAWAIQEMASRGGVEEDDRIKPGVVLYMLRGRVGGRPARGAAPPAHLAAGAGADQAAHPLRPRPRHGAPRPPGAPVARVAAAGHAHRRLVLGPGGLPVPAFDRLGRAYRMTLRADLPPQGAVDALRVVSRHDMRDGDAVQLLAFRPSAWQARLDKHGEGGLGMAILHCPPQRASKSLLLDQPGARRRRRPPPARRVIILLQAHHRRRLGMDSRRLSPVRWE